VEYYEKSGGYKKLVTSSFVKVKTLPDESLGRVSFYRKIEMEVVLLAVFFIFFIGIVLFGSGYFD
jgi:hypothetical protein